jgi:hypothetical protein
MILNEPSHLCLVNSHAQKSAIKIGQYCIYARAVIHTHNVMAGAGRYANCRLFCDYFGLWAAARHSSVCRNPKSLRGAQLVDLSFQ